MLNRELLYAATVSRHGNVWHLCLGYSMFIIDNVGFITRTHVKVEHAPLHLPHQGHHIHFGRGPSQARPPQDPKVFGFDYTCLILRQLPPVTLLS